MRRLRPSDVIGLCEALLSGRGEASGAVIAREALDAYARLSEAGKAAFFDSLARDFGPDRASSPRRSRPIAATPTQPPPRICII